MLTNLHLPKFLQNLNTFDRYKHLNRGILARTFRTLFHNFSPIIAPERSNQSNEQERSISHSVQINRYKPSTEQKGQRTAGIPSCRRQHRRRAPPPLACQKCSSPRRRASSQMPRSWWSPPCSGRRAFLRPQGRRKAGAGARGDAADSAGHEFLGGVGVAVAN